MKQFKIILGLVLFASVTTFAQSPRIKLNQITKDTVKGSVLISSPSDSGMVYSRDFYIAYGADTLLILYGDTIGGVGGGVNSIVVDPITLNGNGTTASPLSVDTATVISTIQGFLDTLTNRNYLTTNQTITLSGDVTGSGSTAITATVVDDSHNHIISNVDNLQDSLTAKANASELSNYVTIAGTETISGAKTFTDDVTINKSSGNAQLNITSVSGTYPYFTLDQTGVVKWAFQNVATTGEFTITEAGVANHFVIATGGDVGIGENNPSEKLDVNGKVKIQNLTGTGGNAVYENGGVLGVASDARFKTYIGDIVNGIELINQLKPKYFIDNRNSSFQQLGFYAQEVKSVINEASYPIGNTDYLGINDRAILATSVKAIQEQQAIIETQQQKITDLETTIQSLITRIENLENK